MDFFVALDKNNHTLVNDGKTARSNIIYIPPGHTAILSLFNMMNLVKLKDQDGEKTLVNESCLTIKKLSFDRTVDVGKLVDDLCSNTSNHKYLADTLLRQRGMRAEPVYQDCCPWSINPANNMALIPTPGFYVLETDDIDQLNTAYVEYAVLTADEAKAIPNGFKLGN